MAYTTKTIRDLAVSELMQQFRRAAGVFPGSKLSRPEVAKLTPMGAVLAQKAFANQALVQILTVSTKQPKLNAREYRDVATSYFEEQVINKVIDLGGPSSQRGDGIITQEELDLASSRIKKVIPPAERENVELALRYIRYAIGKAQSGGPLDSP